MYPAGFGVNELSHDAQKTRSPVSSPERNNMVGDWLMVGGYW